MGTQRFHHQHGGSLRHRLNDEHTWHHGMFGEMALEEMLVHSDVFHAHGRFVQHDVFHAINHEHGVSMRDRVHDARDIDHRNPCGGAGAVFVVWLSQIHGHSVQTRLFCRS